VLAHFVCASLSVLYERAPMVAIIIPAHTLLCLSMDGTLAFLGILPGLWVTAVLTQIIASSVRRPPGIQISASWFELARLISVTAVVASLVAQKWAGQQYAFPQLRCCATNTIVSAWILLRWAFS